MRFHDITGQGMIDVDEIAFVGVVLTDERTYINWPYSIVIRLRATDSIILSFKDKGDAIEARRSLITAWGDV
jgi:hypothetical protein